MIYTHTPVIKLEHKLFHKAGVDLFVKREDLNHPHISGNKWWKLKYNLRQAVEEGHATLLTFGGAYSNHLYATAAAGQELGLQCIGVVRGEETHPLNATLEFCRRMGMHLHYVSRKNYREKDNATFITSLKKKYGKFYLIPEGGTNSFAIRGCEEWAQQLSKEIDFDYFCLPVGTGGTIAGMINELRDKTIIGFSSLKDGAFLGNQIRSFLKHEITNWRIETGYHFGGYAKVKKELLDFIIDFEKTYRILLDPVYTGKTMYGVLELIKQNTFKVGSKILVLHTGGLQGRVGFNF